MATPLTPHRPCIHLNVRSEGRGWLRRGKDTEGWVRGKKENKDEEEELEVPEVYLSFFYDEKLIINDGNNYNKIVKLRNWMN